MKNLYWSTATGFWTYHDEEKDEYFVWIELNGIFAYRPALDPDVRVRLEAHRNYTWPTPNPPDAPTISSGGLRCSSTNSGSVPSFTSYPDTSRPGTASTGSSYNTSGHSGSDYSPRSPTEIFPLSVFDYQTGSNRGVNTSHGETASLRPSVNSYSAVNRGNTPQSSFSARAVALDRETERIIQALKDPNSPEARERAIRDEITRKKEREFEERQEILYQKAVAELNAKKQEELNKARKGSKPRDAERGRARVKKDATLDREFQEQLRARKPGSSHKGFDPSLFSTKDEGQASSINYPGPSSGSTPTSNGYTPQATTKPKRRPQGTGGAGGVK